MFTRINSAVAYGIKAFLISVEAKIKMENSKFHITGLVDEAINESKKRIVAAFHHNNISLINREIVINLAPANLKKEGTSLDLAIAIAILNALGIISLSSKVLDEALFLGELSLDGNLNPVRNILNMAIEAKENGIKTLVIPLENCEEASLVEGLDIIGIKNLKDYIDIATYKTKISIYKSNFKIVPPIYDKDFNEITGQSQAKRVLQIAAAGFHNIIFMGPPGSGKSMLAQRLPTIMPPMEFKEILETNRIYSASKDNMSLKLIDKRPFRSPHHNISSSALIGGGSIPTPGEISLAHNGILFLDELTEFRRNVIESLRQPLENKSITITRSQLTIEMPASFLLIGAMNPCPCGYLGDKRKQCNCTNITVFNYLSKISGPFLDRIDLQLFLHSIEVDEIKNKIHNQSSADLYEKIKVALKRQMERFKDSSRFNSSMSVSEIEVYCILTPEADKIIKMAFEKFKLSMRSYHKIIKISRTIADLEDSDLISDIHIKEALMYRALDQKLETLRN